MPAIRTPPLHRDGRVRHKGLSLRVAMTAALACAAAEVRPQALPEAEFLRLAALRDQALGHVLYRDDDVLFASLDLRPNVPGCTLRPEQLPNRTTGTSAIQKQQGLQAPAGSAEAAYHAEIARQREARAAWHAAFRQVKPAYDREWEAAFQAHRRALGAARTQPERKQIESDWDRTVAELRARHFGPLGPEPVVEQLQAPEGVRDADKPLVLPAVRVTLLRIGVGLQEPVVPVERNWNTSAPVQDWLGRLGPLLDAACPEAGHLVLMVGFYELMHRPAGGVPPPLLVQRVHFLKVDGRWQADQMVNLGPRTQADALQPVLRAGAGNPSTVGSILHWPDRDSHDVAFGRFFDSRPPAYRALPGIEWRERHYWDRFEDEDRRQLMGRGAGDERNLRRFEAARVVFAGVFDAVPKERAYYDTYLGLLAAYQQTCPAQLARQEPVEQVFSMTQEDPRSRAETMRIEDRRTVPRSHLSALRHAHAEYRRALVGVGLAAGMGRNPGLMDTVAQESGQRQRAAQRFLLAEGCDSAAVRQLMDNYARAMTGQPSIQQALAARPR
ncbi:MAG: hypothetical protein KF683_12860 [Rubrivivax sp.]|nr:hypothetical protein [Rubrivivax sp.]